MEIRKIIKSFILTFFVIFRTFGVTKISYKATLLDTTKMEFIEHMDEDKKSFKNALALNVEYDQIPLIRMEIEKVIGKKLDYFKGWNKQGEAHVTTITPPEYVFTLAKFVSMKRINQIAQEEFNIQKSTLKVLGIGSGKALVDNKEEETFFLIVDSNKLRSVRHAIYKEFVKNGGNPKSFDPMWFFPHITIGFTKADLHENNGVIKSIKNSFDERFKMILN